LPNDPGYYFGSAHSAGVNVLLADGSVRMVPYTINPLVWNNLGDRRDGQAITIE
jgi:prepilin-type processing-associated H-X9-DG protein